MGKPTIYIGQNKGADQLRGNRQIFTRTSSYMITKIQCKNKIHMHSGNCIQILHAPQGTACQVKCILCDTYFHQKKSVSGIAQSLAFTRKIGNRRGSEGLRSFKNSNGTNLLILIVLAGDIEMNPGPRFQCRLCKKYCKTADQVVECADCEKRFHASCANLGKEELLELESGSESWYCSNCKAECCLCSGLVLNCHKAVQCDKCDMWVHNDCSFLSDSQYETTQNTNCTWICPKCDFFIFSDSFFDEQLNLESENRFNPLGNSDKTKSSAPSTLTSKSKFIGGLKFFSININSIRGKKLELLAFIDLHEPQIVAIQETKIDSSISSSELFPETFPYSVYRKDRTLDGGGVMLLIHKDIPHMPMTELENKSEELGPVFAHLFQQSINTGEVTC